MFFGPLMTWLEVDTTWGRRITQVIVPGSIFPTTFGREKTIYILPVAFADGGNQTWAPWSASQYAIHYAIATRQIKGFTINVVSNSKFDDYDTI